MTFDRDKTSLIGKCATLLTMFLALVVSLSACSGSSGPVLSSQEVAQKWEMLCSNAYHDAKVKKWEEDLEYLTMQLERRHKNLYHRVSKEDFAAAVANLRDALPDLDDPGRFVEFVKLVASVGDAHTFVSFSIPLHWFPVQTYWFKEGVYVTAVAEEYAALLGKRLVSIGGVATEEVYQSLIPLIAHENEATLKSEFVNAARCAEVLKHFGYIDGLAEGTFEFEDADGSREAIVMKSVPNNAKINVVRLEDALGRPTTPLWKRNPKEFYWYEYVDSEKMLYFQYNTCEEDKNKPVKALTRELMDFVDSHDVEKFVVDLRNNGGGNSRVIEPLLSALAKSEKINNKGHLFVVIGRSTFSSAILNALTLKNNTEAIFIGEPTGGRPNHFGEVKSFNLPNSGLSVRYSTKYFRFSDDDSESLYPDILVEPSFSDLVSNTDSVLEEIRDWSP
ncbi:MAG: S41 family peptidase [Bacillota bacterium]|jgi:hypothetical protein